LATVRIHILSILTSKHAETHYQQMFGLRLREARTILLLGAFGPMTLKDVCNEIIMEKAYASRMIAQLIEKDLVHKNEHPMDRRLVQLYLTKRGCFIYQKLYADTLRRNERWLSVLTEQERITFSNCLQKLAKASRKEVLMDAGFK
jgi:DNA-binding MarR family transcriptional regulator